MGRLVCVFITDDVHFIFLNHMSGQAIWRLPSAPSYSHYRSVAINATLNQSRPWREAPYRRTRCLCLSGATTRDPGGQYIPAPAGTCHNGHHTHAVFRRTRV
jgi:hypothetical protein